MAPRVTYGLPGAVRGRLDFYQRPAKYCRVCAFYEEGCCSTIDSIFWVTDVKGMFLFVLTCPHMLYTYICRFAVCLRFKYFFFYSPTVSFTNVCSHS